MIRAGGGWRGARPAPPAGDDVSLVSVLISPPLLVVYLFAACGAYTWGR